MPLTCVIELLEMDDLQNKYSIKSFDGKSGKQRKLQHEEIDLSIYRPTARCAAFTTSEDKILFWVKALQDHYYELLRDNSDYHIQWIDHLNGDESAYEHIELKISHQRQEHLTLLFTITIYLTTGVIMCQASTFDVWSEKEFPRLKQRMEEIYSIYHGASATRGQEGQEDLTAWSETQATLEYLDEAFQVTVSHKKEKTNKKSAPVRPAEEKCFDDELTTCENPPSQINETALETPKLCHQKRRNSFDSIRGLSVRSKASIADLKSVVATLESDVMEIKNAVSSASHAHDLYTAKFSLLEDKIVQMDNSHKTEIKTLSSRVIDLETTNECLQGDNTKLKNEIQNLKKQLKGVDKRLEYQENKKNLAACENKSPADPVINPHSGIRPATKPQEEPAQVQDQGDVNLANNFFHMLSSTDQEGNLLHSPPSQPNKSPQNVQMKTAKPTGNQSITQSSIHTETTRQSNEATPTNENRDPDIVLLAPVVQRLDNVIRWIRPTIQGLKYTSG